MTNLTPCTSSWEVPAGFTTYELTQTLEGPINFADGHVEYGPRVYHWGIQHIYDDGSLRIVVRPGDRDTYSASGYYMSIDSLAGQPGQPFPNVHAALAAAHVEVLKACASITWRVVPSMYPGPVYAIVNDRDEIARDSRDGSMCVYSTRATAEHQMSYLWSHDRLTTP